MYSSTEECPLLLVASTCFKHLDWAHLCT